MGGTWPTAARGSAAPAVCARSPAPSHFWPVRQSRGRFSSVNLHALTLFSVPSRPAPPRRPAPTLVPCTLARSSDPRPAPPSRPPPPPNRPSRVSIEECALIAATMTQFGSALSPSFADFLLIYCFAFLLVRHFSTLLFAKCTSGEV